MEFLLLLSAPDHFDRWAAMTPDQVDEARETFRSFAKAVAERGEIVAGDALRPPASTRTVAAGPGREMTDGPYAETVEQLAGFYVIDVDTIETATDLARLLPDSVTVEVRPTLGAQIR
jgi:hypothetical protein